MTLVYATGEMAVRILADGEDISDHAGRVCSEVYQRSTMLKSAKSSAVTVPDDYVAIGADGRGYD